MLLPGLWAVRVNVVVHNQNAMKREIQSGGAAGAVYGLGFIGATVYFVSHAGGFWMGVWGILKAMVWPALLVYEAFEYLNAV